jgi:hypothetical protein
MDVTVTERALTVTERAAGWSHVYETSPRVTGRTFTVAPLPLDLTRDEGFALLARVSGYTFTLVPLK